MSNEKECKTERECLLQAFECLGLCHHCWKMFLEIENKPELADKLHKWFHGNYADNRSAGERLGEKLHSRRSDDATKQDKSCGIKR